MMDVAACAFVLIALGYRAVFFVSSNPNPSHNRQHFSQIAGELNSLDD